MLGASGFRLRSELRFEFRVLMLPVYGLQFEYWKDHCRQLPSEGTLKDIKTKASVESSDQEALAWAVSGGVGPHSGWT